MLRHIRDPRLIATFAIGFGVLFNFVATFTYIGFHLAAPPYSFSATFIGALFVTYLASSVVVPWVGRGIALFGRRRLVLGIIAAWIVGALLMLLPPVTLILTGLTLCAVCGMLCQTVATGYVTMTAQKDVISTEGGALAAAVERPPHFAFAVAVAVACFPQTNPQTRHPERSAAESKDPDIFGTATTVRTISTDSIIAFALARSPQTDPKPLTHPVQ
jgi:MFS family permease